MEGAEVTMKKGFWTLEERLAFAKLSPEEKEAEIQKGKEEDAKLTEWPPVPDSYLDI